MHAACSGPADIDAELCAICGSSALPLLICGTCHDLVCESCCAHGLSGGQRCTICTNCMEEDSLGVGALVQDKKPGLVSSSASSKNHSSGPGSYLYGGDIGSKKPPHITTGGYADSYFSSLYCNIIFSLGSISATQWFYWYVMLAISLLSTYTLFAIYCSFLRATESIVYNAAAHF